MDVPSAWSGTKAEWLVYSTLQAMGEEFQYGLPLSEAGGLLLDFFLPKRNLAVNIKSDFPAYGIEEELPEQLVQALTQAWSIDVVYLYEDDVLKDPTKAVGDVLGRELEWGNQKRINQT